MPSRICPPNPRKKRLADRLRGRPTNSEIRMRKLLRQLGWAFCFQFPIGGYIADFIFIDRKLIVEVDGSSHQGRERYDALRDLHLQKYGYRTLRIKSGRIDSEAEQVLAEVRTEFWRASKCFQTGIFVQGRDAGKVSKPKRRKKRKPRRPPRRGNGALRVLIQSQHDDEYDRRLRFEHAISK